MRLLVIGDETTRFFVEWWHRMHSSRQPLVAAVLKVVQWIADDNAPECYLWEICQWPQHRGPQWTFVCWSVDGCGAWWKRFPSKRAALAYYRQPVEAVMQPHDHRLADSKVRGVRLNSRESAH